MPSTSQRLKLADWLTLPAVTANEHSLLDDPVSMEAQIRQANKKTKTKTKKTEKNIKNKSWLKNKKLLMINRDYKTF